MSNFKTFIRAYKKKLLKHLDWKNEDSQMIAKSLALGVFIGFTPTLGIQTFLSYLFSRLFKKNFAAIFIGTCLQTGTPFQEVLAGALSVGVGNLFLRRQVELGTPSLKNLNFLTFLTLDKHLIYAFLIGSLCLGIIGAILIYGLSYWLLERSKNHGE